VASRVLWSDRVPESQRFLMSLAAERVKLGPKLHTGPLYHAERFILEAMGGFEVKEMSDEAGREEPVLDDDVLRQASVLVVRHRPGPRLPAESETYLMQHSRDYSFYGEPVEDFAQLNGRRHRPGHLLRKFPLGTRARRA
jgi:hypothetical protein